MRNPIIIALLHPVNLAMLALVAAAGLCSAWWLFPIGVLLWGLMVASIARNPALRAGQKIHSRITLTPRFQAKFDRIERAQVSLVNSMTSAPSRVQYQLKPVQAQMDSLIDEIYALCQRSSGLENYRLVNFAKTNLETEWVNINREIERASDPRVKQELQEALKSLEQRIIQQRKILNQLDHVDAQLTSAENTLENIFSEVLRLQSMGIDAIKQNRSSLIDTLHQLENEIRQVDQSDY